jgi:hypothetical protein
MMARLSPFFPAMVVFIGALFVAAGGFWASWRQSNFNIEIRDKNEEIARLQHENAATITGGDKRGCLAEAETGSATQTATKTGRRRTVLMDRQTSHRDRQQRVIVSVSAVARVWRRGRGHRTMGRRR